MNGKQNKRRVRLKVIKYALNGVVVLHGITRGQSFEYLYAVGKAMPESWDDCFVESIDIGKATLAGSGFDESVVDVVKIEVSLP